MTPCPYFRPLSLEPIARARGYRYTINVEDPNMTHRTRGLISVASIYCVHEFDATTKGQIDRNLDRIGREHLERIEGRTDLPRIVPASSVRA